TQPTKQTVNQPTHPGSSRSRAGVALRRACDPKHVSQPSVGTRTDYPQHRSVADRIRIVMSAPADRVSRLGLSSRPSIRRALQFPLWNRAHSRVSSHGRRHCRFLVSVSLGEVLTGVAWYPVLIVSIYAQCFTGYSTGYRLS